MPETVTREIVLPLERDEAWRVVTEPDHLREWLADDVEIDLVEGGRIVETGTHADLLAHNGAYADLYRTQLGRSPADDLEPALDPAVGEG